MGFFEGRNVRIREERTVGFRGNGCGMEAITWHPCNGY